MKELLSLTDDGLYCEVGGFHIDPWRPVQRAVITHAHADHARWGSQHYLTSHEGEHVLRLRMGPSANINAIAYGELTDINGIRVSLHPAGHILGSAQIRVEHKGEVWVVTGDYKTQPDVTCTPFELVKCHTFVTECTFGLPIYRWRPQQEIFGEINAWWRANSVVGKASVIFGYALGKSQRILAGIDASIGPIFCHGAVERVNSAYRQTNIQRNVHVRLPVTNYSGSVTDKKLFQGALIVAPPSAQATPWLRKFGDYSDAFASGWMQIRGARRQRGVDRGFVLSDHVDWTSLMEAISATGAERVMVTHGYTAIVARFLNEQGIQAQILETRYESEGEADAELTTEEAEMHE